MPYLLQPPAHSFDTCNPLFTYTLTDPTPPELSKIKDLQNWGWQVSSHSQNDAEYLAAIDRIEKAIKKRHRRTQMIYGSMMGGPRLTFEEIWEQELTRASKQGLCELEVKEEDNGDQGSIMSQMTQQKLWLLWADGTSECQAEEVRDIQVVDEQSPLPTSSKLEESKNTDKYVYQKSAVRSITGGKANSTSCFIEASLYTIASPHSLQRADSHFAGQDAPQSPPSSTSPTSSEEPDLLLLDPYMLAMATCGHWSPPVFLRAWSRQDPQPQSTAPRAELSPKDPKRPRKLRKKLSRRYSEPSLNDCLPPRSVSLLSWVKRKRFEKTGGNANLVAPQQQRTRNPGDAEKPPRTTSLRSTLQSCRISLSTTLSDGSSRTLRPTTSAEFNSSLDSHPNKSTPCHSEPRRVSPAPSTASSLIFPGREISQEEYSRRTNRPQENLQPRQLTPPPGLEEANDPYEWQAWDIERARQESKTDRMLGRGSMRRSSAWISNRGNAKNDWYDEFQKKMKEEKMQAQKEQKEANKKKEKEMKKLERQEKNKREEEVREMLKKQGMFSVGYLPRYT